MTANEVVKILEEAGKKSSNVLIKSKSGKEFKQKVRLGVGNMLCIGNYNSKCPNYRIGDTVTDNWGSMELIP